MAIAIGAMVGSGVFILPGVAYVTVDGPAVVLAFLLAGILILPAAFSASEMATAMPEDGGSRARWRSSAAFRTSCSSRRGSPSTSSRSR